MRKNIRLPIGLVHGIKGGADGVDVLKKDLSRQPVARFGYDARVRLLLFYPQHRLFLVKHAEDSAGEGFSEWIQSQVGYGIVAGAAFNPDIDVFVWPRSWHGVEVGANENQLRIVMP